MGDHEQGQATKDRFISPRKQRRAVQTLPRTPKNEYALQLKRIVDQESVFEIFKLPLHNKSVSTPKAKRHYKVLPMTVIDAPYVQDNFYHSVLSWADNYDLAFGCVDVLRIWNSRTKQTSAHVLNVEEISSVYNIEESQYAVGTEDGEVILWDSSQAKRIRSINVHEERVSSFVSYGDVLVCGSQDCTISFIDRRDNKLIQRLIEHTGEVCELKYNPIKRKLASGGNDNLVLIWDPLHNPKPLLTFNKHVAAVKAIDWCDNTHETIATGGGTKDRRILIWNTETGEVSSQTDTYSQITSLHYLAADNQLVTSVAGVKHQLVLYTFPSLEEIHRFEGHKSRIIDTAVSPTGDMIASISADQTVQIWPISYPSSPAGMFSPAKILR